MIKRSFGLSLGFVEYFSQGHKYGLNIGDFLIIPRLRMIDRRPEASLGADFFLSRVQMVVLKKWGGLYCLLS